MSKFINYTSALTSVTAQVDTRSLSAVPHFTEGNTYTTLTCGFSASRTFNGYSFDTVEAVMLSAENNELLFVSGGDFINYPVSGFTSISSLCDGATLSPELSGLLTGGFTINNYNSITITFPTLSATGNLDILLMNAAGYGSLKKDINTTITVN